MPDLAKYSIILLYMKTAEGTLRLRLGAAGLTTDLSSGKAPTASIPEATDIARRVADKIKGYSMSLVTETLFNIPTTAHILGGCCMGDSAETGVIDHQHRAFGYDGLYVIDGSAVSANPGVNPLAHHRPRRAGHEPDPRQRRGHRLRVKSFPRPRVHPSSPHEILDREVFLGRTVRELVCIAGGLAIITFEAVRPLPID